MNQVPNTSTPGASQAHATTPASFSTLGGTPEFLTFSTPTPSRSGVPSPNVGVTSAPLHVELTLEGVANNFLELRSLLNQYVSRERDKGVRIRLDYDEPEPTLSPGPPIPPFASGMRQDPAILRILTRIYQQDQILQYTLSFRLNLLQAVFHWAIS